MNKKVINYITNIVGVAIILLAFYEYFGTKQWSWFVGLIIIGASFLVIENNTLKGILKGIIGFKTDNNKSLRSSIDAPDPKKEEK